jgi:hypothetical protein
MAKWEVPPLFLMNFSLNKIKIRIDLVAINYQAQFVKFELNRKYTLGCQFRAKLRVKMG